MARCVLPYRHRNIVTWGCCQTDEVVRHDGKQASGAVVIEGCSVYNTLAQGVLVGGKAEEAGLSLTLRGLSLNQTCHYDPGLGNRDSKALNPIMLIRSDGIDFGGSVLFEDCTVQDASSPQIIPALPFFKMVPRIAVSDAFCAQALKALGEMVPSVSI